MIFSKNLFLITMISLSKIIINFISSYYHKFMHLSFIIDFIFRINITQFIFNDFWIILLIKYLYYQYYNYN